MPPVPTAPAPRFRQLLAIAFLGAVAMPGGRAFAQSTPPGFESIPRPPGSIGSGQNLMPPGAPAGVLAPPPPSGAAPSNPMVLGPARPVALPPAAPPPPQAPTTTNLTPTVPVVP